MEGWPLMVPRKDLGTKEEGIRTNLIAKNHEPPQVEHGGTATTTELISRRY